MVFAEYGIESIEGQSAQVFGDEILIDGEPTRIGDEEERSIWLQDTDEEDDVDEDVINDDDDDDDDFDEDFEEDFEELDEEEEEETISTTMTMTLKTDSMTTTSKRYRFTPSPDRRRIRSVFFEKDCA